MATLSLVWDMAFVDICIYRVIVGSHLLLSGVLFTPHPLPPPPPPPPPNHSTVFCLCVYYSSRCKPSTCPPTPPMPHPSLCHHTLWEREREPAMAYPPTARPAYCPACLGARSAAPHTYPSKMRSVSYRGY